MALISQNRHGRGLPEPPGPTWPRLATGNALAPQAPPDDSIDAGIARCEAALDAFTARWDRGEAPRAEEYLPNLADDPDGQLELIYREFCLAERAGLAPSADSFAARFPAQAGPLRRMLVLHGALGPRPAAFEPDEPELPEAGDAIGPYALLRELGRGAFARVFLAEQADLDDRLVVVKVSARDTPEPRLLARARHAHIVEVLRHASLDSCGLNLICMPFLGGATLAAVLEARRKIGRRPKSGRDLLADLDRASAPEYPACDLARPAREILAGLSHAGAVAWVVARLAEALDHADRRGVTHGDLKPSNILLTADGVPMLFDFNLGQSDDAPPAAGSGETGGTLAYMAPERLDALAEPGRAPARPLDRHRADLYALGLILREALTGLPPELPRPPAGQGPASTRSLASALADSRRRGASALAGHPRGAIPPALRGVLGRCLAADPADRYGRASELAADLDRWRQGRPLAFAPEPACRPGLLRWAARQRVAVASVVACLALGGLLSGAAWAMTGLSRRDHALEKLAQEIDFEPFRVYPCVDAQGLWADPRLADTAGTAFRVLGAYGVPAGPGWRRSPDVLALPPRERADLEALVLEQAFRLARHLGDRPDAPGDWRRALACLESAAPSARPGPLADESARLRGRLGLPAAGIGNAAAGWLDDYLRGVEAEPRHASAALENYRSAIRRRPDAFWPRVRASAVAARLGFDRESAGHLERAVALRPGNLTARLGLARAYYRLGRLVEAEMQCAQAEALAPDSPDVQACLAFIHADLDRPVARQASVERFGLLDPFRADFAARRLFLASSEGIWSPRRRFHQDAGDALAAVLEQSPQDERARVVLAGQFVRAGDFARAVAEYDRVLEWNPGHLEARFHRATLLPALRHPAMAEEVERIVADPRFEELLPDGPAAVLALNWAVKHRLAAGEVAEALGLAERSRMLADRTITAGASTPRVARSLEICLGAGTEPLSGSHYALARVHAVASRQDPARLRLAARHLDQALQHTGDAAKLRASFWNDRHFEGQRDRIAQHLPGLASAAGGR